MPDLPTGTVTLLFTDIEGSTRLLMTLGHSYQRALSDHRALLRRAFNLAGGQVVDRQGDSFFVVFPRAKDALTAAVEGQRALASHPWPDGLRLRVRMGIHTGEPAVNDEGLTGLAVHRAARICAAARGEQILVSSTTRDLVEDELPAGTELRELGEFGLKDFDRPARLFQVVADGLRESFPVGEAAEEAMLADDLARQADAVDRLARLRPALRAEIERAAAQTSGLQEEVFNVRRGRPPTEGLIAELNAQRVSIQSLCAQAQEAERDTRGPNLGAAGNS
jgi:class 3 adenylate cyclase